MGYVCLLLSYLIGIYHLIDSIGRFGQAFSDKKNPPESGFFRYILILRAGVGQIVLYDGGRDKDHQIAVFRLFLCVAEQQSDDGNIH